MQNVISAVKKNLDLSKNIPLKIALYDAFKKTIISRKIHAGTRINEKEVSEALNISRTPIRYALGELVHEKLVEHTKKGIVVKGISVKDAYEIFEIRKALDTLATIKAIDYMEDKDFDSMQEILKQSEYYSQHNDTENVLKTFSQFNLFIYEKSQMLRLKEIVLELQEYLSYFREISVNSIERRQHAIQEHRAIFNNMKEKNIQKLTTITHEHLDRSLQVIVTEMEKEYGE